MDITPDTATRSVQLNVKCNLNCVFCESKAAGKESLTSENIIGEIDFLKSHQIHRLVLHGGEPTLSEHLPKLIKIAKNIGVGHIDLHTNGLMLAYADYTGKLAGAGLGKVRFFFISHGRENYDAFSRTTGYFPSFIKGVENAAEAPVDIEFAVPVFSGNLESVAGTVDFILSNWPDAGGVFLIPARVKSPEFQSREQISELKLVLSETAAKTAEAGVRFHFNFWNQIRQEVRDRINPDIERYLTHRTDCYDCSIVGGCHGTRLLEGRFFPDKFVSDPEQARSFHIARTGDYDLDLKEDILHSELERRNIFTFYRPDRCGIDHLHQVIVRTNFSCNQRCPFCYNDSRPPVEARDIEFMIRKINRAFRTINRFSFSGGEPTLNDNLEKYIELVRGGPARMIEIQTNAVRLASTNLAARIAAAGVDDAFVSLHAHEAGLSDSITGRPGNFEKSLTGIDNLIKNGIHVELNHVISSLNHTKLPEFVRFVCDRFPDTPIVFSMAQPFKWFPDDKMKYIPRFTEFAGYLKKALDWCIAKKMRFSGLTEPCGIPLCILDGQEKYYGVFHDIPTRDDEEYIIDTELIKVDVCRKCDLSGHCFGIRARYAQYYGTHELRPIRTPESKEPVRLV